MGKRKISHAAYAAWDYKKEIEDLNKKSQEGWQLVKGGCFKSIYEQNDQVCYRYQLDYNTDIENKVLYLEMFEDQGWEYINSTFNGWHFFRKPYNPELPEEEYEIYTDSSAIPDMERRWVRLAYSFMAVISAFLVFMIIRMIQYPEWTRVPMILFEIDFIVFLGLGIYRIRKKERHVKKIFSLSTMMAIAVVCWLAGIVLGALKPDCSNTLEGDTNGGTYYKDFTVHYPDNFYLDLEMDNDSPVTFRIDDANGEAVYTNSDKKTRVENKRIWLKRGDYRIGIASEKGDKARKIKISYELD